MHCGLPVRGRRRQARTHRARLSAHISRISSSNAACAASRLSVQVSRMGSSHAACASASGSQAVSAQHTAAQQPNWCGLTKSSGRTPTRRLWLHLSYLVDSGL